MNVEVDLRILELLSSRLCHELISPVGAVNNGVELLDEDDPEFVREAMGLIGQSARRAGKLLQFYRFAYGTAGTGNGSAQGPAELTACLFDGTKIHAEWTPAAVALPVEWLKLALNTVVLAAETLPRGGALTVDKAPGVAGVLIAASGPALGATEEMVSAFSAPSVDALTSRTIQAYFTARLCDRLGAKLEIDRSNPETLLFRAISA